MPGKINALSIQNDSFYNTLTDLVHKERLTFADAYQIKKYLIEEDFKKTTNVDERVINYIAKNLKDWHTLVTNQNASKIFLALMEGAKNNLNLCERIRVYKKKLIIKKYGKDQTLPNRVGNIGWPTVHHWIEHLMNIDLVVPNEFPGYGTEKMWRINDSFEIGDDSADLVKEENKPPKNRLKLRKLGLTAYFCMYMLEHKSVETAREKMREDFSFLLMPIKKEVYLNEQ